MADPEMTSLDRLCAAIAIIQDHILASDTSCNVDKMFGRYRFETAQLEMAARLLVDVIPDLEMIAREAPSNAEGR